MTKNKFGSTDYYGYFCTKINKQHITMKRFLTMAFCVLAVTLGAGAQNLQKGSYGYLYCHMSDKGEWTAYALSRDGYHYETSLRGKYKI